MTERYYAMKDVKSNQYFKVYSSEALVMGNPGVIEVIEVTEEEAKRIRMEINKRKSLTKKLEERK